MAEPRVMMKLGDFAFGVDTAAYNSLTHTISAQWVEVKRLGREGASQFTGFALAKVALKGVIHPGFQNASGKSVGLKQVPALRTLLLAKVPHMLVAGSGAVLGRWVVLDVEEGMSEFVGNGWPRKIEFSLTLQQYGEDKTVQTVS